MMYLLADPGIIYLDLLDNPENFIQKVVERVTRWIDLQNAYEIEFLMTERCRRAILDVIDESYTTEALHPVFDSMSHDIVNSIAPLLESLLAAKRLDPLLSGLDESRFDTKGLFDKMIVPAEYGKRIKSEPLRSAFYDMLWRVVVAREHLDNPPKELETTGVLTAFEGRKDWYHNHLKNLFVVVGWKKTDSQKLRTIVENLPVIDIDKGSEGIAQLLNPDEKTQDVHFDPVEHEQIEPEQVLESHKQVKFRSVLNAVDRAVEETEGMLILPQKSRQRIKHSVHFDDKAKIYELLIGLKRVWLTAYQEFGQEKANLIFKMEYGHEVASYYGEATVQNPKYARNLMVNHGGEVIITKRHIKLSDSSRKFRINFQEQKQSDGSIRLIIGWIGRHHETARFDG